MKRIRNLIIILATIFFVSCTSSPSIDDFVYTYTMESINNYKIEFQLKSDSTFKVSQFNYFFDNYESMKKPVITEGQLNNKEFSTIKKLLQQSNLNDMKDSYGFDETESTESDIIYLIELKQDDKSKFVTIKSKSIESFPKKFTELISYTNSIISEKHKVL
ncbi:MAG: hypothetical protein ACOH2V_02710 [Candidatus Saccharimonadaceae bacterium]